jgi:hypothetical protein
MIKNTLIVYNYKKMASIKIIKDFLKNPSKKGSKRNQWSTHICTLTLDSKFNWNNYIYEDEFEQLGENQMNINDAAIWLLIFLFRKPKPTESEVDYTVSFQRAIKVLRDNIHSPELRQLFQFLSIFQKKRLEITNIPMWFELAIIPLCVEIGLTMNIKSAELALQTSFEMDASFWMNLVEALTFQYVPYWLNNSEYVRNYLLFQLLQNFSQSKELIESCLKDKPDEYFRYIQADLLIYLAHCNVLTRAQIQNILFNFSRRKIIYSIKQVWLYESSLNDQIIRSFLIEEFKSLYDFSLVTKCITFSKINKYDFNFMFKYPGNFFVTLLENSDTINKSNISVDEIKKFFNLFWWNPFHFLAFFNHEVFVTEFMKLYPQWQNLFIQLFRCERNHLTDNLITIFAKTFLKIRNVNFDMELFNLCSIYMKKVVSNMMQDTQKYFLNWLINHAEIHMFAHFPLTPELVKIAQKSFPDINSQRKIFWSIFMTKCVENYQKNDVRVMIDMGEVCREYGFQISLNSVIQTISNFNEPVNSIYNLFGIIYLDINYLDKCSIDFKFSNVDTISTILPLEGLHLFRQMVIKIKNLLNLFQENRYDENDLTSMIQFINANQEFIQKLPQDDQNFLKDVFNFYLPKLDLSNRLINGLLDIANLFPYYVKQMMIEACPILRILENKRKRSLEESEPQEAKKKKLDVCDPNSYECECTRCHNFVPLSEVCCSKKYGEPLCMPCYLISDKKCVPMNMTLISFAEIDA